MASNHGRKSRAQGLLYLGVDLGTTQLKAGLFDERGIHGGVGVHGLPDTSTATQRR